MDLIISDHPKVVSKTYPYWWLDQIIGKTLYPSTPNQTFSISFTFIRGNRDEYGLWELSEDSNDKKTVFVQDVFTFATEQYMLGNTQPYEVLTNLTTLAANIAKTQGVIE